MVRGEKDTRFQELKAKYPNVPEHCLPVLNRAKKQSPANKLTDEIIRYLKAIGGIGYRINVQGQWDSKLQKWRPSGMMRGISDILGVVPSKYSGKGLFIAIEIKSGRDHQSEYQKLREREIIKAGGIYLIAKTYNQFINDMNSIY